MNGSPYVTNATKYLNKDVKSCKTYVQCLANPQTRCCPGGLGPPEPPTSTAPNMSTVGHDTCTKITEHACTMIIVHACTMLIVHACAMFTVHACTMIIVHACTVIIVRACTMIIVDACTMIIVHACTMIIHHWTSFEHHSGISRASFGHHLDII